MSFYRKLSPLEITFLADDAEDHSMLVNQFILEGEGDIDIDHFKKAVETAALANPGSRLKLKGYWGWRHWDDEGPLPSVEVVENSGWDGESDQNAPFLGGSINPRVGPNTQILIVKNGSSTRIVFRTHHATMDGMGTISFVTEIFKALHGMKPDGSNGRKSDWDITQAIDYPQSTLVKGNCIPATPAAKDPTVSGCRWTRLRWQGDYKKIVAKMTLAACRVAWRNNGDDKKIIMRIPSDLRPYLGEDKDVHLGNLTGAIDLEITPESTISSIQQSIVKQLKNKQDLSVFPSNAKLAYWLPKKLFRNNPKVNQMLHEKGTYPMTGTVTFLGHINPSLYNFGEFKALCTYGVPIPYETKPIYIGFSVNPDGLNAVVGVPNALANEKELDQLCEDLKGELDKF